MTYECLAYFIADPQHQRKDAFRQSTCGNGLLDHPTDEFRRSKMGWMRLGDNRTARRQSRSRITTRDRERQRKIASAKYSNGTERNSAQAQIGAWHRLTVGQSRVDGDTHPSSVLDNLRKHFELPDRSSPFPFESCFRQATLRLCPLDKGVSESQETRADCSKEVRTDGLRRLAIDIKGLSGKDAGAIDISRAATAEEWLHLCTLGWIERTDGSLISEHFGLPYQHCSANAHGSPIAIWPAIFMQVLRLNCGDVFLRHSRRGLFV